MTEQELNILIHKQLTGQTGPAEETQFQTWLTASEANPAYFEKMAEIWSASEGLDFEAEPDTDAEWSRLRQTLGVEQPVARPTAKIVRMNQVWRLAAAAAVVIAVSLWWLLGRSSDNGLEAPVNYAAASGKTESISLPDGTLVALNAGSTLTAQAGFGGENRKVQLSGEAFFEVTHDPKKPFIVEAGTASVTVLGTKFNVLAYPESGSIITALTEGKVAFSANNQKVTLTPGMEAVLEKISGKIQTRQVKANDIAAWRQGKLVFDNVPLVEALGTLGRRYGVSVKIEGDVAGKRLFSTFENEPLEAVIKTLKLTYDLDFQLENDTLRVRNL